MKVHTYKELTKMNTEQLKKVKSVKCPKCKKNFNDKNEVFFEKHAIRNYGRCMTCEDETRGPGMAIGDNFERFGNLIKKEMDKEKND